MICDYPGAYSLTEKERKRLCHKSIIVFDTDTLEAIMDLSDSDFSDLIYILKKSKVLKRLWLPQDVEYAYFHNLTPGCNDSKMEIFFDLISPKQIGRGYNKAQLAYLYTRGQERYDKHIPPGLVGGESDKRIYFHDYLIWKEMQAYAGRKNRDILFVKKILDERWFEQINGKVYTNHNIANEFFAKTKKDFNKTRGLRFVGISIMRLFDLCDSQVSHESLMTKNVNCAFISILHFKKQDTNKSESENQNSIKFVDKNIQSGHSGSAKAQTFTSTT
ncbi:MAG TPA: hypothetical protein DCS83_08605 [Prevotella sp.]|nr:hypothetical protein [Prevotella sp.]